MAPPRTGLRLLHTAALLVMVAYISSAVFVEYDKILQTLSSSRCLPADFNMTHLMTTIVTPCLNVLSGGVPETCADVPQTMLMFGCFANSMDQVVTVNGVTSFDDTKLVNLLLSLTDDVAWSGVYIDLLSRCQSKALSSLTPQRQAVFNYACIHFSLLVDCHRRMIDEDRLEEWAMQLREKYLDQGVLLILLVFPYNAPQMYAACSKLYHKNDGTVAERYDGKLDAMACLLKGLEDPNTGYINSGYFFTLMYPWISGDQRLQIQEMEKYCGPNAPGYKTVTAPRFVECGITQDLFNMTYHYFNQWSSSMMPETCLLSV